MPIYNFRCKKCNFIYDALTRWDKTGKYSKVKCPECKSIRKEKLMSDILDVVFTNPRGTSREDSATYAGDYNMEVAKETRRVAERNSKNPNPYPKFNDF